MYSFSRENDKNAAKLIDKIMKDKRSFEFRNPVDVEYYGLVDYYDVVKKPMDLGTIKVI